MQIFFVYFAYLTIWILGHLKGQLKQHLRFFIHPMIISSGSLKSFKSLFTKDLQKYISIVLLFMVNSTIERRSDR